MKIEELSVARKVVTVQLDYDELRCLNNALHQVAVLDSAKKDSNFNEVYSSIIELFSFVKHGCIPLFELCNIYSLRNTEEEGGEGNDVSCGIAGNPGKW